MSDACFRFAQPANVETTKYSANGPGFIPGSSSTGVAEASASRTPVRTTEGHRTTFGTLRVARPLLKTPEQGARGLVYLAADPKGDQRRGQYFVGTAVKQPAARGRDEGTAERLYSAVEAMLAPWGALPPIPVPDSSLNGEPDRGGADGTTAQD